MATLTIRRHGDKTFAVATINPGILNFVMTEEFDLGMHRPGNGPGEALAQMAMAFLWIMERGVFAHHIDLSPEFIQLYEELTPEAEFGPRPPFQLMVLDFKLDLRG